MPEHPSDGTRDGERPLRHLAECALHHRNLKLVCRRCRHVRILQGHAVWWLFERRHWDDRLDRVARRFWCTRCWLSRKRRQHGPELVVTRDAPTGDPWPLPDEREWKRLVQRYRS